MNRDDRRRATRFEMEIPVWVRVPQTLELQECVATSTKNISLIGLCFATDLPLVVGMPIEVSLRMPEQVIGTPSREWCCRGRVVRVEPVDPSQAKRSVGVEFHYYELRKNQPAPAPK
jgi:hypothetical protein